ncbi:MAG TPA: ATP-binding cassette domain-containing protein [Puia sp.]|nr:ATP-binding cassette domain-containing protein [Puia sp.]
MDSPLLQIESVFVQILRKEILRNISMKINPGEQWIIFGEAGSGKTVLANTLAGHHASRGWIDFHGFDEKKKGNAVVVVEQQHRFLDLQNQSNFYYQQRYNAMDAEATMTVSQALAVFDELPDSPFSKSALVARFHLDDVLSKPLIQLSNGENKRLQILKAVLCFPALLILDEPFTGLDTEGRKILDGILAGLAGSGQHMLLLTSRNFVPSCFNRYAQLQNGELKFLNSPVEIQDQNAVFREMTHKDFPSSMHFSYPDFNHAVRMRNVHVEYDGKKILDGINWEIEKGACWGLSGHNGAGKSTLLSLITADNPKAYANDIYLFDRKRGSGESIWEIKQKIGYLSPELQLYFDPAATVFTAVASGLFDTIGLFRRLSADQEHYVSEWLQFLNCAEDGNRLLNSLPAGLQRMILLGRSMIKIPPLLILDEPCQGLDGAQTALTLHLIDHYCVRFGASLIYVSHYQDEFPSCISQTLQLRKGKIL